MLVAAVFLLLLFAMSIVFVNNVIDISYRKGYLQGQEDCVTEMRERLGSPE